MNYWWMNTDASAWDIFIKMSRGDVEGWTAHTDSGRYKANMKEVRAGDRGLCYQTHDRASVVGELAATGSLGFNAKDKEEQVPFRLERFIEQISWSEVMKSKIFHKDRIKVLRRPTLSRLTEEEFQELLKLSAKVAKQNEEEQIEITAFEIQRPLSEIREELRSAKPSDPAMVSFKGQKFSRDNKTISQLKILRGFKCQLCGTSIIKRDGSKYIEAAHITAKRNRGNETASNVVVLCPNHHKEFDFGLLEVLERNETLIRFKLNGVEYKVDLSL